MCSLYFCTFVKADADPLPPSAIDDLAPTVQVAIEEIERQTGWKSMLIIGGLEPRGGDNYQPFVSLPIASFPSPPLNAHRYTTGRSSVTGLEFQEAHPEVAHVRMLFNEWLRTVYSRYFIALIDPSLTFVLYSLRQ